MTEERLVELANPTIPKELAAIKHAPKPCEDCGATVVDRRCNIRRSTSPYPHWKVSCTNCNKYQNPSTGKFDMDQYQVVGYHRDIDKAEKQANKSAAKTAKDK